MTDTTAYPLSWPDNWPRTAYPERSRFDVTPGRAIDDLLNQLRLVGADYIVVSSNVPLRRDGRPRATYFKPADCGVAVYFLRDGRQMVYACDRWDKPEDNIRAIAKTIEALRGISRWGATDMMERAFAAFEALPPPKPPADAPWWVVLGLDRHSATIGDVEQAFRRLAKQAHPDKGGTHADMSQLTAAREKARDHFARAA